MHQSAYTISSLFEYIDAIEDLNGQLQKELIPKRLYYRGQSDAQYKLLPSLARQLSSYYNLQVGFERRIVEYVEENFPNILKETSTPIDRLAFLQHHGAPTRLLDITASSLVALYFAAASHPDDDGEVIAFAPFDRETERYPMDMAIADSYRMIQGSIDSLEHFYQRAKHQEYFLEQKSLVDNYVDKLGGGQWVLECCESPLFVHSYHHTARQRIQQSSFILFPNDINTENPNDPYFIENISPLSKDNEVVAGRITVPSDIKTLILSQLKHAGITRSMLFADSIDIICEESGRIAKEHTI